MNELQTIPFHGDTISAVRTPEGKIMVSVRHICDALGLADRPQFRKLQAAKWARTDFMIAHDATGRAQELLMIDHEALPIWMATVHPSKVVTGIRSKIEAYQLEAKQVLADHFIGNAKTEVMPYDDTDPDSVILAKLLKTRQEVLAVQRQQEQQWQAIKQTELLALEANTTAQEAKQTATALHQAVTNDTGKFSVLAYARKQGFTITLGKASALGRKLTDICTVRGIGVGRMSDPRFGYVNVYPIEVIEEFHDDFIKACA